MLRWYPSTLLRVVLELTLLPIAFLTIFAVMVLSDFDTQWSGGPWQGPGPTADFWKLVTLLAVGWTILVLGWRGAGKLFRWLVVPWHVLLTAGSLAAALEERGLLVRGDAVNFSLSVRFLAPALSIATLVCTLLWIRADISLRGPGERSVSPLQRRNRIAAGCAALSLAAASLAFHMDFDELGVIAGVGAVLACHEAMRPLNPSVELHRALVAEGSARD